MVGKCTRLSNAVSSSQASRQADEVSIPLDEIPDIHPSSCTSCQKRLLITSRNLKRESERLKTFQNWKCDFLDPKDLAKDGFYYTNVGDTIRCAFCGVQIGCWEKGDIPSRDHEKYAPRCDFVEGKPCGNVPTSEDESVEEIESSLDICGPYGNEIRPFSGPERAHRDLWKDLEHLGVSKTSGPVSPSYSTYESRIKTFDRWPCPEVQDPKKLAEAGFYYTAQQDNTICFHCGGGLQQWDKSDDPWVEHARWFNNCGFINIQKGKDFVNNVTSKRKAMLPAKAAEELLPSLDEPATEERPEEKTSDSESGVYSGSSGSSSPNPTGKMLELCVVCYSRDRAIVFLPCGHFVACVKCAPSLPHCPVCRKPYEATVRAYLS